MSTYTANPTYVGPGRPPCICGAAYRLHHRHMDGERLRLVCPEAYRPGTLAAAQRELAAAEASGDEARVFVARGEVQRLEGRPRAVEVYAQPGALPAPQGSGYRAWPEARELREVVGPCLLCGRDTTVLQGVPDRPGLEVPIDPGCMLRFIVLHRKWLRGELDEAKPMHRRFLEALRRWRPPLEAGT